MNAHSSFNSLLSYPTLAFSSAFSRRSRLTSATISGGQTASRPCSMKSLRSLPASPKASAQASRLASGGWRCPRITRETSATFEPARRENSRMVQSRAAIRAARLSPKVRATRQAYARRLPVLVTSPMLPVWQQSPSTNHKESPHEHRP